VNTFDLKTLILQTDGNTSTRAPKKKASSFENHGNLLEQLNKIESERTPHFISSIMIDNPKHNQRRSNFFLSFFISRDTNLTNLQKIIL